VDIFGEYFGKDNGTLNDTAIRENFSIVYQVLDEFIDGGFPSTTEINQLKEMIKPPTLSQKILQSVSDSFAVSDKMAMGLLSKIPWRRSDVKYVTNEIYFDIVESVDAIFGDNQMLISSNVYGEVRCNSSLSDMPDLQLTFNKPSYLDDVSLHRCVRISRFQREKVVSFVPPDGKFSLMSFRIRNVNNIPIYVKPTISFKPGGGKVHILCGTKGQMKDGQQVNDVVVIIPFPKATISSTLTANVGVIRQDQITKVCRWIIGRMPSDKTPELEGSITLPVDHLADERPTVTAEFSSKGFSAAGIKVDSLVIKNVKYKPFKGVRGMTKAGRLQIRT